MKKHKLTSELMKHLKGVFNKRDSPLLSSMFNIRLPRESTLPNGHIFETEKVAKGADGVVYKCRYRDSITAIKVITSAGSSASEREELMKEIHILSIFKELGETAPFLQFYDYLFVEGKLLIVMEFYPGRELRDVVMSSKVKVEIFKNLLDAVYQMHSHKVVHTDLHMGNVLFKEPSSIKIIDMGRAICYNEPIKTISLPINHPCKKSEEGRRNNNNVCSRSNSISPYTYNYRPFGNPGDPNYNILDEAGVNLEELRAEHPRHIRNKHDLLGWERNKQITKYNEIHGYNVEGEKKVGEETIAQEEQGSRYCYKSEQFDEYPYSEGFPKYTQIAPWRVKLCGRETGCNMMDLMAGDLFAVCYKFATGLHRSQLRDKFNPKVSRDKWLQMSRNFLNELPTIVKKIYTDSGNNEYDLPQKFMKLYDISR